MKATRGRIEVLGMQQNRRKSATGWTKALYLAVGVALAFPQVCPADLAGLRAPLPTTPATISQFRAHLPGSSTTGPATNDAEIQELARGLKYDPGLMYKFVHDHVQFTPTWGEVKGPYMTWMDRSGNAFDQASLLIALLTQANGNGHTITNLKYVVGDIILTNEQFCSWFGLSTVASAAPARVLLARGGFYADVTENGSGYITTAKLAHVWVKATIDSNDYQLDPSFKSHTSYSASIPLSSATGYSTSSFLADAEPVGGGWDKSSLRSDLATFTTNLINSIRSNDPSSDVRSLFDGKTIDPLATATLPGSLPYTVDYTEQEFAIGSIPDIYRTTLRLQHEGIDQTLYSSDIYGRRLSLKYNGSHQPQLILEGTVKATGNATTPGNAYDLTLTVDHPYETASFDSAVTLKVKAGGFYQIVNGWGDTGTKILLRNRGSHLHI